MYVINIYHHHFLTYRRGYVRETVTTMSGRRLDAVKRKYATGHYLAVSKVE